MLPTAAASPVFKCQRIALASLLMGGGLDSCAMRATKWTQRKAHVPNVTKASFRSPGRPAVAAAHSAAQA
jgi:hypothetical protein